MEEMRIRFKILLILMLTFCMMGGLLMMSFGRYLDRRVETIHRQQAQANYGALIGR